MTAIDARSEYTQDHRPISTRSTVPGIRIRHVRLILASAVLNCVFRKILRGRVSALCCEVGTFVDRNEIELRDVAVRVASEHEDSGLTLIARCAGISAGFAKD